MTFYGDEIGLVPTMTQIEIYISEKGLYVTPQQVWDYWSKKNWLTLKGQPVKTLEAAVHVVNGIVISSDFYRGIKLKGKSKRQKRKEKAELRKAYVGDAKRKAKEIAYESHQPQPYSTYKDQLTDPKWKAFREFVFKVRGKECEVCESKSNLQVHHTHYNKGAKAWEYTCNDVMVVCRECHKKIHELR